MLRLERTILNKSRCLQV